MCKARSQLIDAFFKLTAERGLLRVEKRDIVKAANVSKRSFYNYFTNQEDILEAIHNLVMIEIIHPVDRLINNFPVQSINTIKQGASVVVEFIAPIIYENRELINRLKRSQIDYLWKEPLYQRCNQIIENVGIKQQTNSIISNALATFTVVALNTWVTSSSKLSLDDFKNKVAKLITISIDELIQ